ncbi:MAG: fibronectin type III domain-containing protein, partial [Chthoniobacteraceae bacterium]
HPNPPGGVATLTVTTAGIGRELAVWSYGVRAEYYRVFLKRVGTDDDFINVADAHDLEHTLKNLTVGGTIELYVVPMNDGGTGAASPTVTKVVGA